jgi:N6-L-threonylcarbamoyladenine synthase
MYCLGLETSCDETAAAVIEVDDRGNARICSEVVSSQIKLHALYGGVVPELASREHLKNLPIVLEQALVQSSKDLNEIDCIAVTRGPGLMGCLLVGLTFAKGLALSHKLPLIGVNHIEGHIMSGKLDNPDLLFPFLTLVVSGGHTEIVLVEDFGKYKILARTLDDAAGEAFDKAAHLLGLPYPGGAALAGLADAVSESRFKLPKVMRETEGFSFSGLKTAIRNLVDEHLAGAKNQEEIRKELAFTIQSSIIDALMFKLEKAIKDNSIYNVLVTGGVSANQALRNKVKLLKGINAYFPKQSHCIDNAAMIAYTGGIRFIKGERLSLDVNVLPRWPVEDI